MCGIVGSILFKNSQDELSNEYLIKLRDTMRHRGPNGSGVWLSKDRKIGLAHRRLSIIDLSEQASQPMSSVDKNVIVSFNGEIYNHVEIREQLNQTGKYQWKTDHSDTEVIVNAYAEWGIQCVKILRGMFAIAIWDETQKCLWLVRDRCGIKPLYYSPHGDRLVFASEIKAILEDPREHREINERGFFDYLSFLCVPAPHTLFKGIKKVPNGTWLRIGVDGSITEERYWDVLDNISNLSCFDEGEVAEQLLAQLDESIQIHKASDVPVGVFLSGGIDSSANAALFAKRGKEAVKTFSIGYAGNYGSYQNELHYAKIVAKVVGADYHERVLDCDDMETFLPKMVALQDEPIGDPVCMPVYYVSKLARDCGVSVCQVGEGADELFGGYQSWKSFKRFQTLSDLPVPRVFRKGAAALLESLDLDNDWRYELIQRSHKGLPLFWGGAEVLTHNQKLNLMSKRMQEKYKAQSSWEIIEPIKKRFDGRSGNLCSLDWMSYVDLNLRLPELLLMRVDKMSMGVSLETRVPFLDHKFVEFSMSIPAKLKIKGNSSKYILKKALAGVIPDEIINRKKQGFAAPIPEWLNGGLKRHAYKQIEEFCIKTDLLDWSRVKCLLDSKRVVNAWHIYNAALWWKCYICK